MFAGRLVQGLQAAMPSFTISLHPSEAKEQDFEFSQSQVSLIWHKNPKSCVPVPLGSLKGLQAAKGPSNISSSLEQSPEQSATPHPHLHQQLPAGQVVIMV